MHVQDQNGSTNAQSMCMPSNRLCVDARASYTNGPQVEELGSAAEEHVLKVRKPYTITRQRERWSEEEHNKFLEALKLYGRAWRRVKEHIGTKTAVQIRSHAQKFFTKVARASGSNDASMLKSIAIPPPRPKRKPIHPYPRKLGQSTSKESPVLEQPQRCFSPTPSVSEQENRSPTSVLSLFGDIKRPSTWNGPNNCTSPVSSASVSSSTGMLNDQEIGCQSPTLSIEKTGCLSSAAVSAGMTMQDKSPMELDVGSGIDIPSNNDPSLEGTSLKLFGRTVLVADSQKSSTSTVGNLVECCKSLAIEDVLRGMDVESLPRMKSVQHVAQDDLSGGVPKNSWNSLPADVPSIFCCLPLHRVVTKSGEAPHFPLHVWSPYYGPFIGPQNTNLVEELHQTLGKKGAKEVSWTSSYYSFDSGMLSSEQNNGSFNSLFTGQCKDEELKPALKLRPSENSTFKVHKPSSDKPVRGFMPYRRCVADKEAELPVMANKDADGKRAELCL